MTDTNKCKSCKGTGEIGGVYQSRRDCFNCAGTGEKNWQKYYPKIGTHSTANSSEDM